MNFMTFHLYIYTVYIYRAFHDPNCLSLTPCFFRGVGIPTTTADGIRGLDPEPFPAEVNGRKRIFGALHMVLLVAPSSMGS